MLGALPLMVTMTCRVGMGVAGSSLLGIVHLSAEMTPGCLRIGLVGMAIGTF